MGEDNQSTKTRLLNAAELLFASKGYDQVSVRELAAAGVNVAAVNYHFQGKENLFQEVISRRFAQQRDRTLAALAEVLEARPGRPPLDLVIRSIVMQYLQGALAHTSGPGFLMAVSREMHAGQARSHMALFTEMIAPVYAAFARAMAASRPHLQPDQVSWVIASIVSQVHHFIVRWVKKESLEPQDESLAIMLKVFPPLGEPLPRYLELVADHITSFSTAAIDGMFPEVGP